MFAKLQAPNNFLVKTVVGGRIYMRYDNTLVIAISLYHGVQKC